MRERRAQEMMLYKTRGFYGGSAITKTYCPINGNYKFTYSINDGTEDDLECNEAVSEASDCPTGYKFDLKFRGCSFPDFGELVGSDIPLNNISKLIALLFQMPSSHDCLSSCPLFRDELPVPGVVAERDAGGDLHEPARHQAAPARRGGQAQIPLRGKSLSLK